MGIYNLHVSLKVEGLSVNFSNVTTSSDDSLQMYSSPQCLASGGLINILVTSMHTWTCVLDKLFESMGPGWLGRNTCMFLSF